MPNTTAWDKVPVHAWYYKAPGVPSTGVIDFKLTGAQYGVKRLDGTAIYRSGATISVRVGDPAQQDPALLAILKAAYRARAQATLGTGFNGAAWDAQWTANLPAMICTGFYASDDPDITPQGWQVMVTERLADGEPTVGPYPIPLTMSMIDSTPIPGLNLTDIELPPGTPTAPAPVYAKGQPGGVAALDADGDVVDADGVKVTGGGVTTWSALTGKPATFPPSTHTHTSSQVTDTTTVGRALMTATDAAAARAAIGAGTGSGSGTVTSTSITDATTVGRALLTATDAAAARATLGVSTGGTGSGPVASTDITDSTTTGRAVLTAASAAAARSAIGAGTSSLALGTTSTTAKAGDYTPAWSEVTGKPTTYPPATHTHAIADTTGLQAELDGKANLEDIPTALSSLDGTLTIGQVAPRAVVAAYWNGTAWTSSPASSRLDITVMWIDPIGTSTTPPFVAGRIDTYIKATA